MDPKLKSYLDKHFKSLATKKDIQALKLELKALDKKLDEKTLDVLEVIRNINENVSHQFGKVDITQFTLKKHVDHIFNRINYLEKKLLK